MSDIIHIRDKKVDKFKPDEIKFLDRILFIDDNEPIPADKILHIIAYINGLQDGHELYGKDKPISPIIKEIDNIIEIQPVGPDILWGDIVRALNRRFVHEP